MPTDLLPKDKLEEDKYASSDILKDRQNGPTTAGDRCCALAS